MSYDWERFRLIKARTPAWANKAKIRKIYKQSKKKGKYYNVDHIVPLKSDFVCGLHCEDNLQILHITVNSLKSNLVWPDMWHIQNDLDLECCKVYQLEFDV